MAQRRRKRKVKSGFLKGIFAIIAIVAIAVVGIYLIVGKSVFLDEVTVQGGGELNLSFLLNEDSKDVDIDDIKIVSGDVDLMNLGTREIKVQYKDKSAETVKLTVVDTEGPQFEGLADINVSKSYLLDYKKDVIATDRLEGKVEYTFDSSAVNLEKAGTYFVSYTAVDSKGNTTEMRRKVVIENDSSDTDQLVINAANDIKKTYGDNPTPVQIKNFIVSRIRYNSNWGKPDPIYYGFKNNIGNCYVHALCFEALLEYYGYEFQRIWVTDESHYWTLVKIDGEWKHMDATPGVYHQRYSIMDDAKRYETLIRDGEHRDWDRTKWPACK